MNGKQASAAHDNAISPDNLKRRVFVAPFFIAGYGERYVLLEGR